MVSTGTLLSVSMLLFLVQSELKERGILHKSYTQVIREKTDKGGLGLRKYLILYHDQVNFRSPG